MQAVLDWLGARARWVMAAGAVAAPLLPELGTALRPLLPALVVLVFTLAIARIDPAPVLRGLAKTRRLGALTLWIAALMVATPAALAGGAWLLGLPPGHVAALVYTGAAPPITSAPAICLLLGLDAAFALELTVVASLVTPILGPLVTRMLLGDAVPIEALDLGLRLGAMIVIGILCGFALRRMAGAGRIARYRTAFDGVAAVAMVLFIIPLFDGAWALAMAAPLAALGLLGLALAANLGVQVAAALAARRVADGPRAGAAGMMWGNRTVAFYLAALPPDPVYQLYVALYQFPMLLTPLLLGPWLKRR
ncbi:MAG: hypothetical protein AAGG06_04185 [Pseudomonadota bacterium]